MKKRKDIKKEAERLTTGQINRRRFVMSALATGVTMPTAMSLATKAEALVPRRGGHLSMAMAEGPELDALLEFATGNTLTEFASDGGIAGDLAQSFSHEDGGTRWVFDLHPDATFTDGSPVGAADVIASLTANARRALPGVAEMRATGPDQLVITLSRADMTFPERLARPGLTIRKRDANGHSIGSGGYMIEGADDGAYRLIRRPDYWKTDRAFVDSVSLTVAQSAAALQADVMAGNVDYAAGIAPETVAFLAHLPNIEVVEYQATRALFLHPSMSTDLAPATDAIRALQSHVDRQAFVDRALLGHGRLGDDSYLPPRAADTLTGPAPAQDLTSLGRVSVSSETSEGWVPHLADIARRAGLSLDATLSAGPGALLRAQTLDTLAFADWFETTLQGVSASDDTGARAVQSRLSAARTLEDTTARNSALASACTSHDCVPVFVPAWANELAARSARLAQPRAITPYLPNDGHRLIERWWLT